MTFPERIGRPALLAAALAALPPGAAAQARLVEARIESASLTNRLGDPVERRALVYLPPGYDSRPQARFPVIVLLHSFGATDSTWLGGPGGYEGLDVPATLDSLIETGAAGPAIVVMPDARTTLGGSWYASSTVAGDWETFIADDLVAAIDARFRTLPDRGARGLAGQSMGGYGALRIGMRRPDVFGAVLAMSPVVVEDPNPLGEAGMRLALEADDSDLPGAAIPARVLWSRAVAFSPDPERPPAFARLPYREEDGRLVPAHDVWAAWEDATLARLAAAHTDALARLSVRLEVGRDDALAAEVGAFSERLRAMGIEHELEVFEGGHVAGVRGQFERSVFQYFSRVLHRSP